MLTTAQRHHALPHTSPTAVAYRTTPERAQAWKNRADQAYRTYHQAHQDVADAWDEVFAEAAGGADRVSPARPGPRELEHAPAGARRLRVHWQLLPGSDYDIVLPHCHLIAHPGRARGHAQAPDLRTRTGRAMQADLDSLSTLVVPPLGPLAYLSQYGALPACDAQGRYLGRDSLLSHQVAPGWRYLVFEAPPSPAPDAGLWESVPVAEYLAVKQEITVLTPIRATDR